MLRISYTTAQCIWQGSVLQTNSTLKLLSPHLISRMHRRVETTYTRAPTHAYTLKQILPCRHTQPHMYTHSHTCTHTATHVHTQPHMYTHNHTCTHTPHMYTHSHTCTHTPTHVHTQPHPHTDTHYAHTGGRIFRTLQRMPRIQSHGSTQALFALISGNIFIVFYT